jgi:hypothetical protein
MQLPDIELSLVLTISKKVYLGRSYFRKSNPAADAQMCSKWFLNHDLALFITTLVTLLAREQR